MTLRVGLDLTPAFVGSTGIALYCRSLWGLARRDQDLEMAAFAAGRGVVVEDPLVKRVPVPLRSLHAAWSFVGRPRAEALLGEVDVLHCLDLLPAPSRAPLIMTWHDTFALPGPMYHHPRSLRLRAKRRAAAQRATTVLVLCESLAVEVVEHLDIARERIVVAPPGADLPTGPRKGALVDPPFVLAAGAITPRKGFGVLARALARLGPTAPPLVIAGPDGWNADIVHRELRDALPPNRLILLGDRIDQMSQLYADATVVAHPSLAEGFGLVCLEAMAAGAAVVAADIPSIREMGADAIVLTPADDADELAQALEHVLGDGDERARLGSAAKKRASAYTWEQNYQQTRTAYHVARAAG